MVHLFFLYLKEIDWSEGERRKKIDREREDQIGLLEGEREKKNLTPSRKEREDFKLCQS